MTIETAALNRPDVARNPLLEEAIREDPDRPDAWLVYADWLQAHHDVRGELIALQHARSVQPTPELAAREGQLFDEFRDELLGPRGEFTRLDPVWELGFIRYAHVMDQSSTLLWHPSGRFLRKLQITIHYPQTVRPYLEAMTDCRLCLRVLELSAGLERDLDLTFLFEKLPRLRELWLGVTSAKLTGPPSSTLEVLDLMFDDAPAALIEGFADDRWSALRHLSLDFRRPPRTPQPVANLLSRCDLPGLTHFGLTGIRLDVELVERLVRAPMLSRLESLDLAQTDLRDAGADVLLEHAGRFGKLQRLDLRGGHFSKQRRARLKALCPEVRLNNPRAT